MNLALVPYVFNFNVFPIWHIICILNLITLFLKDLKLDSFQKLNQILSKY